MFYNLIKLSFCVLIFCLSVNVIADENTGLWRDGTVGRIWTDDRGTFFGISNPPYIQNSLGGVQYFLPSTDVNYEAKLAQIFKSKKAGTIIHVWSGDVLVAALAETPTTPNVYKVWRVGEY